MEKRTVFQDGADFYVELPGGVLDCVIGYPPGVKDFDTEGARAAREWFINEACPHFGLDPIFD